MRLDEAYQRQALQRPDDIAVIAGRESLTFGELDRRATHTAGALLSLGVRTEVLVGLHVRRSLDLAIGALGILKAGGVCAPLDASYPPERLRLLLEQTRPDVLLTAEAMPRNLLGTVPSARVYVLGTSHLAVRAGVARQGDDTAGAFVVFSSGTTGTPTPIVLDHRALTLSCLAQSDLGAPRETDRTLMLASVGSRVPGELFGPWLRGSSVVLADADVTATQASQIVQMVVDHRVTRLASGLTTLRELVDDDGASRCTTLREVTCRGEELPYAVAKRLFARLPHVRLHHTYGQTECVQGCSWVCDSATIRDPLPIGRWPDDSNIYVLDASLRRVPPGTEGEIYLGGQRHAREYLRRPDLTQEKFVDNPYVPGERLCRTGDLAYVDPTGLIEFRGRRADRLERSGLALSLRDIELACYRHPEVTQAVVTVADARHTQGFVAFLVGREGRRAPDDELRATLRRFLPVPGLPRQFIWLDSVPLLPSGKVDRPTMSVWASQVAAKPTSP